MPELLKLFAVGIISGIVTPFALAMIEYQFLWKRRKKAEIRHQVFDDVVNALAAMESDALDLQLQDQNYVDKDGLQAQVNFRTETTILAQKAESEVRAFFSDEAYSLLRTALSCKLSRDNYRSPSSTKLELKH